MIRLILVAVFLVLFLVLGIPLLLIEWVIGKFNQRAKDISSLRIVQWAFKMILFLAGTKVVIKGEENVPKNEPVLYVGNHRSYFDIVITYSRVPDLTGYIAKKEMLRWPLLVNWMICIFPEGTRNRVNDTFMEFHEGSFKVASKSGCAVVPMAIYNSAAIFEDHIPWIRKTTVIVEYGKPFYIKDLPRETQKRVGAYSRDLIMENYFRLKEEAKENGYG